ncbi:MAG TPA: glycosyltransferase family 39 protein [Candidatus Omnitrophota bacterium]|nr:glycosyltransferase family 39 protein [Candidatus Omnitrophota bacterium]
MNKYKGKSIFLLGLILLGGIGLRLYELGSHDLWFDEVCTSYRAADLVRYLFLDMNPPLYYVFVHFWTNFFGNSEFQLRFTSVIFGVASIFVLYKLGKLLLDKQTGLISAFLLSISPIHIWYSQEARGYTFSIFTVLVSTYFFILSLRKNKASLWFAFALSSVISLYSSYFYLFILIGGLSVLIFVKEYRGLIKAWVLSACFILICFLPFLGVFFNHARSVRNNFWITVPSAGSLLVTFENFNAGYNAGTVVYLLSTILFLLLLIRALMQGIRKHKDALIILLAFSCLPIAIIFVISQWVPIYIDRQIILCLPFYYIIVALGINSIKKHPAFKMMILFCIFALSALALLNYFSDSMPAPYAHHIGTYTKKPFAPAVSYVKEHYRPGDAIIHSNPVTTVSFEYYWNNPGQTDRYPFAVSYFLILSKGDGYWQEAVRNPLKNSPQEADKISNFKQNIRRNKFKRIWLISSSWDRGRKPDENSKAMKELIGKYYVAADQQEFEGIFITLYNSKE